MKLNHTKQLLVIILACILAFSMATPFVAAGGNERTAHDTTSIDTAQLSSNSVQNQVSYSTQHESNTLSQKPEASVLDPALEDANGTVNALLVLNQASVDQTTDRNETISTLKQHAATTQRSVKTSANGLQGVEVTNTFWIANLVSVTIDTDRTDAQELAKIDGVNAVIKSREHSIPEPQDTVKPSPAPNDINTTYGLDQINATDIWSEFDVRGENTKVAVLDTGVDVSHPDLNLYTENTSNPTYPGGWAEFDDSGNQVPGSEPRDSHYHGTHVSGTVAGDSASGTAIGVAPDVQLMHGMVIPSGSGSTEQVIGGAQWAVSEGADVASLSLGAGCGLFGPVYSQAWIPVIENTKASGTNFVAAAGNGGEGCVGSPGNDYRSFSIGASNADGDIADFSSGQVIDKTEWDNPPAAWPDTFTKPDVSAPGVDVLSAEPGGGYRLLSGTSMATPHVAGAVALVHSANPDLTVAEIEQVFSETAWKPDDWEGPDDEKDTRYGMGIIDVYNATQQVATAVPEYELGDVDENDAVNVQDVQLMQQYLYGEAPENFNENLGDLNRDDEVTIDDLKLLQRNVQGTVDDGEILVSNLTAPDEVTENETITVSADLSNPGGLGTVQEIGLYVAADESNLGDGEPIATTVVDMAPEGVDNPVDRPHETTVTFEIEANAIDAGDYHVGVVSQDDSASDELTVLGSNFVVSGLNAPANVEQGESFDVNATITNTGNLEDRQTVEYRIDGVERTTNVTLSANESTTVEFGDIESDRLDAGIYEHGVFSEDDSATVNITVLEGFFDVEITDATSEASVGETVNVTATVENTGEATDEQAVTYDLVPNKVNLAVVDDVNDTESRALVDRLDSSLPDRYNITLVTTDDLMDEIDAYDTFVVNEFNEDDVFVQDFVAATDGPDTGVVYLDQWGSFGGSEAIVELSGATGDPESTDDGSNGDDPYLQIETDHPVFSGVGETGDQVELFAESGPEHSWHNDYSGQTLASVGQGSDIKGPSIAVNETSSTVLADSLGQTSYLPSGYSEDANQILANAIEHVSGFTPTGTALSTVDDTTETVTLDPGESTTVEFTDTVPDGTDVSIDYRHLVVSEDDEDFVPITIDVDRGAVKGTVTSDTTGDPVDGATVDVTVETDDGDYTATTNETGAYHIENVPSGTHNVTVSADGYRSEVVSVDVPANSTATSNFSLAPNNGSISGTVTASDTGESIANVTIAAEDNEGTIYRETTDENGTYTLDVPSGDYVVSVTETPSEFQPEAVVTVAPGEAVTAVDFTVEPSNGVIDGYVTNAAGVPIEGAHVTDADQDSFNVTTNEDGYYHIEDLNRGTYALRAAHSDYPDSDITFVDVAADETTTQNLTLGTFFEVSNLNAPSEAEQGGSFTVNATITNIGDQQNTRTVFYFPPGTNFGESVLTQSDLFKEVTLDGGESTTVTFTYDVSADFSPGEYEHGVSADEVESTSITITESAGSSSENPSITDSSETTTIEYVERMTATQRSQTLEVSPEHKMLRIPLTAR